MCKSSEILIEYSIEMVDERINLVTIYYFAVDLMNPLLMLVSSFFWIR
jgi:hypothetical protein